MGEKLTRAEEDHSSNRCAVQPASGNADPAARSSAAGGDRVALRCQAAMGVNPSLSGERRYRQAVRKARIQSARAMREFMRGERDFLPCSADAKRDALIAEMDRLSAALRQATAPPEQPTASPPAEAYLQRPAAQGEARSELK